MFAKITFNLKKNILKAPIFCFLNILLQKIKDDINQLVNKKSLKISKDINLLLEKKSLLYAIRLEDIKEDNSYHVYVLLFLIRYYEYYLMKPFYS